MKKENKKFGIFCAFILLIICLYIFTPLKDIFSRDNLGNLKLWIEQQGLLAPLSFVTLYVVTSLLLIPGSVLTILGGLLFGVWKGFLLVFFSSNLEALLAFYIARFLGKETIQKMFGTKMLRFNKKIQSHGFYMVLWLRLIPIFPFSILNYAFGVTNVKLKDYFWGNIAGMLPATFAYVSMGNAAQYISFKDPSVWTRIEVWGPFVLVIFISFLPTFLKKRIPKDELPDDVN